MGQGPLLYEINTRVVLNERGPALQRSATLDDVEDRTLDWIAAQGFEWVWFLGVWRIGFAARAFSRAQLRDALRGDLPDLREEDISGSPFAIQVYEVAPEFGGEAALARLRSRLADRGMKLLLDFVPNHMSLDHPWTTEHSEWLITGSEEDLEREPGNWYRSPRGEMVLAHGRDPYFPGWPDTVQLNYLHPGLRAAMQTELLRVAEQCDGVRCDMAMLILPEVFQRTWGERVLPRDGNAPVETSFWPEATARVRERHPGFLFMGEVYWDLEWTLQQQGFDYTYDKRLYDRLVAADARAVREHLWATPDYQQHSARFLENHDEPRAAATFGPDQARAAAVITYLVPGLRFFYEGQLEGRRMHASMHLGRRPDEAPDRALHVFYEQLLTTLRRDELHQGRWQLAECRPAWAENPTWDHFVGMGWEGSDGCRVLVVVNYGPTRAQCYARLPFATEARELVLDDQLSDVCYRRDGATLDQRGLYLDLPPWGYHLFTVEATAAPNLQPAGVKGPIA